MTPEERLAEIGLVLPPVMAPTANYVNAVQTGELLFLAGHNPWEDGEIRITGKVGADCTIADGQRAARLVALNLLSTIKAEVGELSRVARIVKLLVFVNSAPTFTEQHKVADGASELLAAVFDAPVAPHARSAVGMVSLPFDMAVEIEMVVELMR